jgi:hypothetical protein
MRRVKTITIANEGRDKGKQFVLTEMSADRGERWALRALLAIANARNDATDLGAGMVGLAVALKELGNIGFVAALKGLHYDDLAPLLDEMMGCVQHQPTPGVLLPVLPGEASQIEEITTRWQLRLELIELHLGFSLAGALSITGTEPPSPPAS